MQIREFRACDDFLAYLERDREARQQFVFEAAVAARHRDQDEFLVDGWCQVCDAPAAFVVDRQFAARQAAAARMPNWRERMTCPNCGLNNRQRAIVGEIVAATVRRGRQAPVSLYIMEQVTPTYSWLKTHLDGVDCIGSEYLGPDNEAGAPGEGRFSGVRHENVEALSFGDDSFDLVVSNDVFEHVDRPELGLSEVARVLKPGGELLFTVPFHFNAEPTLRRARRIDGQIQHLLAPEYHGNPLSEQGSLVYHDFGWDLLELCLRSGFTDVCLRLYWSYLYGHLGFPQFYFRAIL